MNATLDLDAMEQRAFSDVNRDGLMEMMMGLVLGIGAFPGCFFHRCAL